MRNARSANGSFTPLQAYPAALLVVARGCASDAVLDDKEHVAIEQAHSRMCGAVQHLAARRRLGPKTTAAGCFEVDDVAALQAEIADIGRLHVALLLADQLEAARACRDGRFLAIYPLHAAQPEAVPEHAIPGSARHF